MRITTVEAVPFTLPYRTPFAMANGIVSEAAHVLIMVNTDEGVSGYAEAVSRPMIYGESQASIVHAATSWLSPALAGKDPLSVEAIQQVLNSIAANNTLRGAIDIALHDVRGKTFDVPVWRLLGSAEPTLRVTRMLGLGSPGEVADEAGKAIDEYGITSFKVKIDGDIERGVAVVRAVREVAGSSATVYVDANQSLTVESAIAAAERLADYDVAFLEEPVPATDFTGRARLHGSTRIPILVDESASSVAYAALQVTHGSARAISIKTARTGFTESARIVGMAHGLHCRTVLGSQGDSAVGAVSSASFGAACALTAAEPAELDYFTTLADQIVTTVPAISDGQLDVNRTVSGTGVDVDADKLEFYRDDK